ncbi:hypothetical protein FOA52_009865 [Chlamydomonas sp. UWO 241]|nr:hypothetical protein FOA52_009865 [Chlamydomonas sp. UWO 241]
MRQGRHASMGKQPQQLVQRRGPVATMTSVSQMHRPPMRTPCRCTHPPHTRARALVQASSSASPPGDEPHAGHAFLHDFCMSIPYGALVIAAGVVAFALGAQSLLLPVCGGGAVALVCSVLSLQAWKAREDSTPYTVMAGGSAGAVAYATYMSFSAGIIPWLTGSLIGLSAACCLFCLYNVAAGGNPPPKPKKK